MRAECWRAQAEPDPRRQAYSRFEPDAPGLCRYFWPVSDQTPETCG